MEEAAPSGPVGVRAGLEHLLPNPRVVRNADDTFSVVEAKNPLAGLAARSGNFAVLQRALSYLLTLGREGLAMVGPLATLNANYIKESLRDLYLLPVDGYASMNLYSTDCATSRVGDDTACRQTSA